MSDDVILQTLTDALKTSIKIISVDIHCPALSVGISPHRSECKGRSEGRTAVRALERHYKATELAEQWSLSPKVVRKIFADEPGVLKVEWSLYKRAHHPDSGTGNGDPYLSPRTGPDHGMVDATTGLRVSELLALRWSDIDFDARVVHVQRGIVYNVVGDTKSDSSKSRMPLAAAVLDSLARWRRETPYAAPADWVFASPRMKGKKPYW